MSDLNVLRIDRMLSSIWLVPVNAVGSGILSVAPARVSGGRFRSTCRHALRLPRTYSSTNCGLRRSLLFTDVFPTSVSVRGRGRRGPDRRPIQ